jgi:hypothetical protein
MKTKIELLKGIKDNLIGGAGREVLQQAIEALDNPLGVLPGDEIDVWDINEASAMPETFQGYDKNLDYSWETSHHGYRYARLPKPKGKVKTLTPDICWRMEQLKDGMTSLQGQLERILKETD